MASFCAISQGQQPGVIQLMTPEMSFDSDQMIVCFASLADAVSIWESDRYYEGTAPSGLSVEMCSSFSSTMYSFTDAKGKEDSEAWTRTWVQWFYGMRESGVPMAAEILEAWVAEGRPTAFDHFYETHGGHALRAEPGKFTIEFYSAL